MTLDTHLVQQAEPIAAPAPSGRLRRYARPALGLLLPVGLALGWEIAVRLGWANGRLGPPPARLHAEVAQRARPGELLRHGVAACFRVAAGFGLGTVVGALPAP